MRLIRRLLQLLLVLCLLAAFTAWLLLRGSLAQLDGERRADLRQPVRIERDARGTATVSAVERRDLAAMDVEIHALEGMDAAIGFCNIAGRENGFTLSAGLVGLAHLTSSLTGVTIQFFGLTSLKTPTTVMVLPLSWVGSRPARTCFLT